MRNVFGNRNKNDQPRRGGSLQRKRFSLESLEDRLLLTAVPNNWGLLAEESAAVGLSGQAQIGFDVRVADGGRAVVGLLVSADSQGGADPGMIRVKDASSGIDGTGDVLIRSCPDDTPESGLFRLDSPAGDSELTLASGSASAGEITCTAFLPGDLNGDGLINYSEYKMGTVYSTAWSLCQSGVPSLGVIEYYLEKYNIDLTDICSVYNSRYDVNMDGVVDRLDVGIFQGGYDADVSVSFFDLIHLVPNDRGLTAPEGEIGASAPETALAPDSFTADVLGTFYTSTGYDVTRFEQTGGVISTGEAWERDCSGLIALAEDGRFVFDATPDIFDFLAPGETLTLTFDYLLDNASFDGLDILFQNLYGGTVTVTVAGVNGAPRGASNYAASYDLAAAELIPPVNVLNGITDPEGESVTASLSGVRLGENPYLDPETADFGGAFRISPQGDFSVDGGLLSELLEAVPGGGQVVFTIGYLATDPHGASAGGEIALTVTGVNDAPRGAWNYAASYDLADGTLSPRVVLLDGVTDPDGDPLTAVLTGAALAPNGYGIPTDLDYASCFSVTSGGALAVNRAALGRALQAVPAGGTAVFTISYSAADPDGASTDGEVTLTVTGVNDAPRGAGDYAAALDLTKGTLSPAVNLLGGVTDPDDAVLTAAIESAALGANPYGIPAGADYSACFTVDENGVFGADRDALAGLLTAVPAGGTVVFEIGYSVSDPSGAADYGTVVLTVAGRNEAPRGAENRETSYDLRTGTLGPAVNVLASVTDPDGDALTASVAAARAEANPYISYETELAEYFGFDAEGNLTVDGAAFAAMFAALPAGEAVTVSVAYTVSDPSGAADIAVIRVSFRGDHDAPEFTGEIADVTGEYGGSVSIDLADYFTGPVSGYTLDLAGDSAILGGWSVEGSVLKFDFIQSGDYGSRLDLSDLAATVTARDAFGAEAVSNTFAVSLEGAQTLTLSLACVTEEFGGADVKTLRTGAGNFGTFYYTGKDDVPQTDYAAIASADTYYLELWVSDTSALLTGRNQFFYSIQAQLNYELGGQGITGLDIEDVYAGKYALSNYGYYDEGGTLLKDIQVTWLFSEEKDWSLLEPVTNGENAFLLARFTVTASTPGAIALSGVTDPVSPLVEGYYCVRTGETAPVDDSQIKTVNVETAGSSAVRGAAPAEYVADGGVYLRTVTEKTATDGAGRAAEIGVNADFIHEWQTHYTEIWVKGSARDAVSAVSVGLTSGPACFDMAEIEFGAAFTGGTYTLDAAAGELAVSASAAGGALGADGYYLLARVKYTPSETGLEWNASPAPGRLTRTVVAASLTTAAGTRAAYAGNAAASDLWANPYDVNDDGEVNVVDFVAFVSRYGADSADGHAGVSFDFNRDGTVDLRDFTAFSNVYGVTRRDVAEGNAQLVFPESFTRRYLGSTLDADNAELVGVICDAAVSAWNGALGTESAPDVLFVVRDLPDGQLAAAQASETDPATGQVTRGIVYLDDDAAGAKWSAQLTPPAAGSSRYDLYTVILHELGHLYGYDAENSAFVSVAGTFDWVTAEGHSADAADLMYPFIEPGVRKGITVQDAAVVTAVRSALPAEVSDGAAGRREALFAQPDALAAVWSLDFAEEVAGALAAGIAENPLSPLWDDGLGGDL
ncbi:MAG: hypothetical protein IJJ20_02130 [Thermoguttaceae bacterium]|nr:hypothetical protein [Thermoguttaceae bacterium]